VAGGGSFLTLPLLIFLGYPPSLANGTNRVGILAQNVVAVLGFHRHGALDRRLGLLAALPATLGAGFGAWAALAIGDDAFRRILAVLMLVAAFGTLFRAGSASGATNRSVRPVLFAASFFGVGVYGGFVQAGIGFLILAVTTAAGIDLVRANALKVLCVLVFTPLALSVFALDGKVDWAAGLALAAGSLVGARLGVQFTVTRGQGTLRIVVQVAIVLCALRLLFP
jgi:uncharacterized membrane protein YfcA